ncbi:acetyl/propionyl/methylcrotonyl-CoA carboxylase subunit alpha [Marinibaculum pumilum]|uniref:Acetyl/propionyl/methylcrotonyl-CoA carboxylase subunit alpha n=1 Tax=Marinibaculum pumilum TaxID=1766165 RepID=A0ABV7L2T7_9PROT
MTAFDSILVANRGEIASRVIRTARALGYRTIAVHSEADAGAPHVALADHAVCIGPPPAPQSYLAIDRIVAAARETGAGAVHPGYGFLAENAAFARACAEAGLVFIGPGADAIELMGNKAAAKRRMIEAGVPCVPGYQGAAQDDATLAAEAERIGFPLMVKAAAGGGGRGMRLVEDAGGLANALRSARSEAQNAFGSGELILEKAILRPRHVELQVFADAHGTVLHLGERDCSVQRRHQKVVEEAPCPVMTPELRNAMGAAAVEAARSIDYRGAGTVEFLLGEDGAFYFLEMNTRLQVEHPVTEMVTGLDLVALQIRVAAGEPLGLTQEQVALRGHAIEVRLYAEDPAQDFLPATGRVAFWQAAEGDGLRTDAGIETGTDIPPYYDPMLAKLIAWGPDRETARRRLLRSLKDTILFGATSNRAFLIRILEQGSFARGEATTAFIAETFGDEGYREAPPTLREAAIAAVLQFRAERDAALARSLAVTPALLDWASGGSLSTRYVYETEGAAEVDPIDLLVRPLGRDGYAIRQDGGADAELRIDVAATDGHRARLSVDGDRQDVNVHHPGPGRVELSLEGRSFRFRNRLAFAAAAADAAGGGRVTAPMHGALIEVLVKPGDQVSAGTRLAVLEAMKMQHEILAQIDGTVQEVLAAAGAQVAADELLIEIEAA